MTGKAIGIGGTLKLKKIKRQRVPSGRELSIYEMMKYGFPNFGCSREVAWWRFRNIPNLWRGLWRIALARLFDIPHFYGQLSLTITRGNGEVVDLGLASLRLITTTGVGAIVDAFQNTKELENFKFHGWGTGAGAEGSGNTALGTELTTQYAVDNTRPTGTTEEGAGANIYKSVATLTPDSGGTINVTEHGLFDQAATGGGVMLDRDLFTAVPITAGSDSLQGDQQITFAAGG
jgi:hypothetical protein